MPFEKIWYSFLNSLNLIGFTHIQYFLRKISLQPPTLNHNQEKNQASYFYSLQPYPRQQTVTVIQDLFLNFYFTLLYIQTIFLVDLQLHLSNLLFIGPFLFNLLQFIIFIVSLFINISQIYLPLPLSMSSSSNREKFFCSFLFIFLFLFLSVKIGYHSFFLLICEDLLSFFCPLLSVKICDHSVNFLMNQG